MICTHRLHVSYALDADGDLLTENAAVLQSVARRYPAAGLGPVQGLRYARLQQWLCFIPQVVKTYTLGKVRSRLGFPLR